MRAWGLVAMGVALAACSSAGAPQDDERLDAGGSDAAIALDDAGADARPPDAQPTDAEPLDAAEAESAIDSGDGCEWGGAPGVCISTSACAAMTGHSSYANECPGPASIECCIVTPSTADNPPVPTGWQLMAQSQVTPDMTTWAVEILDAPETYPMFSTTTMTFGTLMVLARVEWHPPDFQNSVIHRGVTLYVPT